MHPLALAPARRQNILAMLKDEDEMQQLAGLTELCEYLSISTEDNLVAFPTEQVVPLLVGASLQLPAARCRLHWLRMLFAWCTQGLYAGRRQQGCHALVVLLQH